MTIARLVLFVALVVGIAADTLLRGGFSGIAFPVWIALVGLGALAIANRGQRGVSREAAGWLIAAVLAAAGLAWRAAPELQALDFLATLLALGLGAIALGQPRAVLFATRLRDSVWAGTRVLRDVFIGSLPLLFHEFTVAGSPHAVKRRRWPAVRAALIVVAVVAVFGSLLRGADPIFASLLRVPDFDIGIVLSHVAVAGFFAWVFAGWARGAFISSERATRPPDQLPFALGRADITAALATLDVLFALFVIAQLGWLFGGESFLQARTGLTAAQYARQGFFQMTFVVVLVIPLLMATRALLVPDAAAARRHTQLAVPMIVLLLAMILSAALRMRLYMSYYGLTTERFYTMAIMAWLAFVLVWLAATTLRGRDQHFMAGAVLSAFAALLALNLVAPDRVVARVNVSRARLATPSGGSPLDVAYLATLSGDALGTAISATLASPARAPVSAAPTNANTAAVSPVPAALAAHDSSNAERCKAAQRILKRWGPASREAGRANDGDWRLWNAGEQRAVRLAAQNEPALRTVERESCPAAPDTTHGVGRDDYR